MKVVVPGGTGQVGTILARALRAPVTSGHPEPPANGRPVAHGPMGRAKRRAWLPSWREPMP